MSYRIPLTDTAKLLIPTRELTKDDWCQILEKRLALIKPHLKTFHLTTLGEFCVFGDNNELKPLEEYNGHKLIAKPETQKMNYSISTQGIYFIIRKNNLEEDLLIRYIWGISRQGQWLIIKCYFKQSKNADPYSDLNIICIQETDAQSIIELNDQKPKMVLARLDEKIEEWRGKREGLYLVAQTLTKQIALEYQLLNQINSQKRQKNVSR